MLRETFTQRKPRFKGIVRFARKVKRSRVHVYLVLRGQRPGAAIKKAWKEFNRAA